MILWSGKGILVPVAFMIGIFTEMFIDSHFNLSMKITVLVGMGVAALLNQLVATFLVSHEVRYVKDEATGERIAIKDRSSLFYIPVKYWTVVIIVFGIFSALTVK